MKIPDVTKTWPGKINTITVGPNINEQNSSKNITIGGQTALPFLHFEGKLPYRPVVAMEIWDISPDDWPDEVKNQIKDVSQNPSDWAQKCEQEFNTDLLCLRLKGCDPFGQDRSPGEAAEIVQNILQVTSVPLIILGCGEDEKDNEVFTEVSPAAAGNNCLLGTITEDNYRTLSALCLADEHKLIAESPVDINIAKQVNTLAADSGFSLENIVIFPNSPALGYGIEYVYSIIERSKLAGLKGDKMMAQPILVDIGGEVWGVKEATISQDEKPEWGDHTTRGPLWEATTAYTYLLAGADLVIMRHPKAVEETKKYISKLIEKDKTDPQ